MSKLRCASYHEAGHAVVGRLLGFAVGPAWADREGRGGATVYTAAGNARLRIMVSLAGGLAEEVFTGANDADDVDRDRIARLATLHGISADELAVLRAQTRALLDQHRAEVRGVAVALMCRRTLSGEQIDQRLTKKHKQTRNAYEQITVT